MRKRILCVFVVSVLLIVTNVSTSILTTSISDAKWENSLFASINANIREFTIRGKAILSSVEENNAERYYDSRDDSVVQIDTENAESIEHLSINGVDTMRVFKDGDINCVMMDTDNGIFIRVWTSLGISVETNEKIAQNIKFLK